MQFNRGDNVDLSKWKQAKMERENNLKEFKMLNPDMPTSGAGSEFGRERREEARRKKYGIQAKKYKEEDQPWILKQIGAPGRKYKGKKEGLVSENSSYFIFKQQADGSFEAHPVDSWYSFTSVATHKTLNAEEAEEEFGRRDRTFNYFSLMVKKRLKESVGEELSKEEEEEMKAKAKGTKKTADLRITEDDDYQDLMTSEESDGFMSEEDDETAKSKAKRKGQPKSKKAKKKKQDSDDEAEEESDEGDFEGRELDYISEDSSDEEEEQKKIDIKGLDEELQKIEDEEEEEEEEEEQEKEGGGEETKDETDGKDESAKKEGAFSSSSSSDSDDSDIDDTKIQSAMLMQRKPSKRPGTPPSQKLPSKSSSRSSSRPETPTQSANVAPPTTSTLSDAARKLHQERVSVKRPPGTNEGSSSKRLKMEGDQSGGRTPGKEAMGLTEDIVRRYLLRKPMTTKDLLYKLKSKKIGLKSDVIVKRLTEILRKLDPKQTKIKDKTYWFLKE
ncbi:general transcription factor IIF subunit 1-like isoform X2 [Acanthaster planci]|nr:general transcription factor IIF subunit 1-like isoform X2 [Acanthaster planci]